MTLNLRPTPRILDGQNNTILFHHAVYIPRLCMRQRQHFGLGVHSLTNHRNADGRVLRQCTSLTSITSYVINSERNDMSLIDADDSELAASTEAESQQILEWPAICKQVACFCGTSIAAELVARGQLPRGRSLEESELLLQQTAEAMQANLEVQGCFDIRPAVEATAAGGRLNAKQLEGVAATLEAAFLLKAAAKVPEEPMDDSMSGTRASSSGSSSSGSSSSSSTNSSGNSSSDSSSSSDLGTSVGASSFSSSSPSSSSSSLSPSLSSSQPSVASLPSAPRPRFPSLAALAEGISDEERTLLRAIRSCIRLNSVCNEASEALAAVRAERQSNKERLRQEVESWARLMQQRGAAETGAVSIVRGRFCVGVRAGRQGELPRGSVRLSSSSTGATLYMEPQPCVELNNAEALLAEREEMEVQRVLALLSKLLASRASQVLELLDSVTVLDVVAARAKHGRWLGGVRPTFAKESGTSPLSIPGALHPVLMQRGLQPLPQPPSVDDNRFDRDFQAAPAWELRRVLVPDGPRPGELPDGSTAVTGDDEVRRSMLPRPLDLRVPPGKAVVAITDRDPWVAPTSLVRPRVG
ncbi:hypothetical protein Vretimale_5037 [Volvox reticuliferus]|uniref:Uncharacterized protein n=1 Tax=Volvox reticuliferus TaxID=1737510 RepID=A0A8J4DDX8_9CHLO|nr:hypothetical protein Vretimale_5037 [Volvox reticuliferus]